MIVENESFIKIKFESGPPAREYEDCSFDQCDFSGVNLTDISFVECSFNDCDLSNSKLSNTSFKDVSFTNCKMLGLHFDDCNTFLLEMRFENCVLNFSSFYQLKLKGTRFESCQLQEVDFTNADLTSVSFDHCDLSLSVFENTIIEKADFRTASNYSFDPEVNYINKAKFSKEQVIGLLSKFDIDIF